MPFCKRKLAVMETDPLPGGDVLTEQAAGQIGRWYPKAMLCMDIGLASTEGELEDEDDQLQSERE